MNDSLLDNPFWSALQTRHAHLALCADGVARYPAAYAPFLGVAEGGGDADDALGALVAAGESVYLLGATPRTPPGWALEPLGPLAQMVCDTPLEVAEGPPIIPLDETHRADVLALTGLVYPHYFRARTMELGRYFGIYHGAQLAAIVGERLGTPQHVEMSAICTHPDHAGRGLASRLTAFLTNDTLARGRTPFLHVSPANTRAKALYEHLGYRLRAEVPFFALRRP